MNIHRSTPKDHIISIPEADPKKGKDCHLGSGFVLKDEIPDIAARLGLNPEEFTRKHLDQVHVFHTPGFLLKKHGRACVFNDPFTGTCKIHESKPLYCRITNANEGTEQLIQWYQLNHFVNPNDPSSVREWKAYADGIDVIPGGKPEDLVGARLKEILAYKDLDNVVKIPEVTITSTPKKKIRASKSHSIRRRK